MADLTNPNDPRHLKDLTHLKDLRHVKDPTDLTHLFCVSYGSLGA
jgi:hypothetical protein